MIAIPTSKGVPHDLQGRATSAAVKSADPWAVAGPREIVEDAWHPQESFKNRVELQAWQQICYVHGQQHIRIGTDGRVNYDRYRQGESSTIWNIMLAPVIGQVASYLANPPRRRVRTVRDDTVALEVAAHASDLLESSDSKYNRDARRVEVAWWLAETGNSFVYLGWDFRGGRRWTVVDETDPNATPKLVFEGEPFILVDSLFRWYFHPNATNVDNSPFALRRTVVPRDWCVDQWPHLAREIMLANSGVSQSANFELQLANMGPDHGANFDDAWSPSNSRYIEMFEYFERPLARNDYKGRIIVMLGDLVVENKPNIYGTLPVVHFKQVCIPGQLWGEAMVKHMMSPQREWNRRAGQMNRAANLHANPKPVVPDEQNAPTEWDNAPDSVMKANPNAPWRPYYMQPPQMPEFVYRLQEMSLQMIDYLSRPHGPSSGQAAANLRSGIQLGMFLEDQMKWLEPFITDWENGWDRVDKIWLKMFQSFQVVEQQVTHYDKMRDSYRRFSFIGSDLDDVIVDIVPGSAMPTSETMIFARWTELGKLGAPIFSDPRWQHRMLEDLKMGDMLRSTRDLTVHIEKARRNVARIRLGEDVYPDPEIDQIDVHLMVYQDFMATEEFEKLPGDAQRRLRVLKRLFEILQAQSMMNASMQQAALAGGAVASAGMGIPASAEAMAPGSPSGGNVGRMTQGFGNAPTAGQVGGNAMGGGVPSSQFGNASGGTAQGAMT